MEKKILSCFVFLFSLTLMSQTIIKPTNYRQKGFVMQGNIAPTYYFQQQSFQSNFHGSLEYFPLHNLAIHGRTFIALPMEFEDDIYIKNSFQFLTGIAYHPINRSKIDPYIGSEWGLGLNILDDKRNATNINQITYLYSFFAGAKVYMGNRFHLFAQVNYVDGFSTTYQNEIGLKELKMSFGLGLQFFKKEKSL